MWMTSSRWYHDGVPEPHIAVSYAEATDVISMTTWLTDGPTVLVPPIATTVTWRDASGAVLFTADEAGTFTLSPAGFYAGTIAQELVPDVVYMVEVSVEDTGDTYTSLFAVSTS